MEHLLFQEWKSLGQTVGWQSKNRLRWSESCPYMGMGIATGGMGGHVPLCSEFWWMSHPEIVIFQENLKIYQKVWIFQYLHSKVGEIRGEIRIEG